MPKSLHDDRHNNLHRPMSRSSAAQPIAAAAERQRLGSATESPAAGGGGANASAAQPPPAYTCWKQFAMLGPVAENRGHAARFRQGVASTHRRRETLAAAETPIKQWRTHRQEIAGTHTRRCSNPTPLNSSHRRRTRRAVKQRKFLELLTRSEALGGHYQFLSPRPPPSQYARSRKRGSAAFSSATEVGSRAGGRPSNLAEGQRGMDESPREGGP